MRLLATVSFLLFTVLPMGAWGVAVTGCSTSTKSASVGVVLGHNKKTGALRVRDVPAGLAGDKAGLRAGDRIKMIDGMLVDRMTPERIREMLRGPVGTRVTITVIRGERVHHVEVTREALAPKGAASTKPAK